MMTKKLLFAAILFLGAAPCWGQTCSNTAVGGGFICIKNAMNNGGASTTVTYASGYTVNNTIIVGVEANSGANLWAVGMVTNTFSYTWTFWGDCVTTAGTPGHTAIYYATAPSTNAGSDTITASPTGSSFTVINSAVYSGVSVIDGAGACGIGTSPAPASGNYAVTTGDLNIGVVITGNGLAGVGSGWNNRANDSVGGGPYTMLEDQLAASGTANATFTATNNPWAVIGIAFKPPGPSGSGVGGKAGIGGKAGLGYWQPIWRKREDLQ